MSIVAEITKFSPPPPSGKLSSFILPQILIHEQEVENRLSLLEALPHRGGNYYNDYSH